MNEFIQRHKIFDREVKEKQANKPTFISRSLAQHASKVGVESAQEWEWSEEWHERKAKAHAQSTDTKAECGRWKSEWRERLSWQHGWNEARQDLSRRQAGKQDNKRRDGDHVHSCLCVALCFFFFLLMNVCVWFVCAFAI